MDNVSGATSADVGADADSESSDIDDMAVE
jgi:hypothetical protein